MNKNKINWMDTQSIQDGARRIGIRNIALGLKKRGFNIHLAFFILQGYNYPRK